MQPELQVEVQHVAWALNYQQAHPPRQQVNSHLDLMSAKDLGRTDEVGRVGLEALHQGAVVRLVLLHPLAQLHVVAQRVLGCQRISCTRRPAHSSAKCQLQVQVVSSEGALLDFALLPSTSLTVCPPVSSTCRPAIGSASSPALSPLGLVQKQWCLRLCCAARLRLCLTPRAATCAAQ